MYKVTNLKNNKVILHISAKLMSDPMRVTRLENHLTKAGFKFEITLVE